MACYYKYKNFEAPSIQELRNMIIDSDGKLKPNEFTAQNSDFCYYNLDTGTDIYNAIINNASRYDKEPGATAVTSFLNSLLFNTSNFKALSEVETYQDILNSFRTEFGSAMHYAFEAIGKPDAEKKVLWTKFTTELTKTAQNHFAKFNEFQSRDERLGNPIIDNLEKSSFNFIAKLVKDTDFQNRIKDEIANFINKLTNEYPGCKILTEQELISAKSTNGAPLRGKADILIIAPNGEVTLIDFKNTTNSSPIGERVRASHWGQLEAYSKILNSYGIDPTKIKYKNIILNFNVDASANENVIKFDEDTYNSQISNQFKTEINAAFAKYFPRKITVKGNEQEKLDRVKAKHVALCSEKFLNNIVSKDIKEAFLKKVKDTDKNTSFSFLCFAEPSSTHYRSFRVDGDKVTVILGQSDGNITKSKEYTIDSFIEAETKARIEYRQEQFLEVVRIVRDKDLSALMSDTNSITPLYHNLIQYFSSNYEYVATPMENEFIITFKNHTTGNWEFVQWVPAVSNFEYSPNPNQHILESIVTDPQALSKYEDPGMRFCIGDIYRLRAALTIGEFIDGFDLNAGTKIGDIKLLSAAGTTDTKMTNLQNLVKTLKLLQTLCQKGNYKNGDLFKDAYDKISKLGTASLDEIIETSIVNAAMATLKNYDMTDKAATLESWDFTVDLAFKKAKLKELVESLTKEVATVTKGHSRAKLTDALDYCKAILEKLDNTLSGMYAEEMYDLNQYSATVQESIVMGYNLLAKGTIERYTKKGLQLTGLLQGMSTSSTYQNPDQFINRFNAFTDNAISQIIEQATRECEEINKASEAFITNYGKSFQIINDNDSVYKSLFANETDMILKNPYALNVSLTSEQKNYLEIIIWNLYKHSPSYKRRTLKNYREGDSKYLRMTFAEFKESDKFEAYKKEIEDSDIFTYCPLLNGQSNVKNLGKAFKSKENLKSFMHNTINRIKNNFNGDNFSEYQRDRQDRDMETFKITNKYWNWKDSDERMRIAQNESGWTYNMNQVIVDYILEDIKTEQFRNVLQIADRALSEIRVLELATGKDFSKQAEELLNRVKISIYGRNLIDKEFNDLTVVQGIVKEITSLTKIAVRPGLWVKEMILGRLRNTMNVLTNQLENENKITMTHLTKAAGIVFGPNFFGDYGKKMFGQSHFGDKTIVDLLNEIYQINDMDLPVAREKMAWDSYGLRNFGSRVLYTNVISPDWFNRMTLLTAKMLADGTWEAHSIKDGKLVYDISKDTRVQEFWIHRNDTVEPKTRAYIDAKNFYLYRMNQFEKEGWKNPDGTNLQFTKGHYDSFPRCYTTAEMRSYKEQIGLIYGYYSHQERASMQKGLWWFLYTQFLTFLPAEVRRNLAIGNKSSIMKTIQEKDYITGKPLYWEEDETGLMHKSENAFDKNGNPNRKVLTDLICPREGLFISTLWTVNKILRLDTDAIKNNPQRLKNTTMWIFNHLLFALFAAIIALIFGGDDSKTKEVTMVEDTIYRVSKELDMYHSVIQPLGDFGFVGQDILQGIFTNAFKGISSDNYSLWDAANDSFSVLSDMHLDLE